jgi:putative transposase
MARIARVVIPGVPHHITQRGNNAQDLFFVDDDREAYLELLERQCERYGLEVLGYCLMTNHVHLVARPFTHESLANAIGRTHFVYTQYINRLHGRRGHLWQNRFYSCALDEAHLWSALRYVERNPVRARMVRCAWEYAWSSAAAHTGGADRAVLIDVEAWRHMSRGVDWREMLTQPEDEDVAKNIRLNTRTGRPLGNDRFLSKVETLLGRRVRALPVGRPKKWERESR